VDPLRSITATRRAYGHRRSHRARLLMVALLVASLSMVGSAVGAADGAVCLVSHPSWLTPGMTMTPGTVTASSRGFTGTIVCHGEVNGASVTGPGRFSADGVIRGTCAQGKGTGSFVARVPTTRGEIVVPGHYSFEYVGVVGRLSGPFSATVEFVPTSGDCLTTPVTSVAIVVEGVLVP
jgi:hypothetical protein